MKRNEREWSGLGRWGWARTLRVLLALSALGAFGCASQTAKSTGAVESGAAAVGSTQPVTMTWDAQNSCVNFNPPTITIRVGDKVRFNSSVGQSVQVQVSASAFGANDTTFTVSSQGS